MLPINERLNNTTVVRVYRQMIENAPIEVVKDLRKNLKALAKDHPRTQMLEEYFVKRLGE